MPPTLSKRGQHGKPGSNARLSFTPQTWEIDMRVRHHNANKPAWRALRFWIRFYRECYRVYGQSFMFSGKLTYPD